MNIVELKYKVKERPGNPFAGPDDVYHALKPYFNPIQEELFIVPTVAQECIVEKVFVGGLDESTIDLRTIFHKLLVQYPNCNAFLIAHNHPSGDVEPSYNDLYVTRKVKEAAKLLGYHFLDHLIFSNKAYYSLKEHNLLEEK